MDNSLEQMINQFFSDLLDEQVPVVITQTDDEISVELELSPDISGVMIGYRGEVLTSLQLVLSLMAQRHTTAWIPVRVNVNNYREQRSEALDALARNTADRVLEQQRPLSIPNLSSFERRLIHSVVSEIPGVTTYSEGEGANRVIVISPE